MKQGCFRKTALIVLTVIALVGLSLNPLLNQFKVQAQTSTPSFPGAEGFGKNVAGGRGGKVLYVTNTNDSGTGSLRAAIQQTGARMVLFKVSGTITLQSDLEITNPFITIAGQTAPGNGIQIKGGMIKILTHDVILRYLKVRMGNPNGSGDPNDTDSVSLSGNNVEVYNVMIDHSTLIWGTDIGGMAILTDSHDVTVQDSILGEGLNMSAHSESPHSTSLNITQLNDSGWPTRITLYHNLITSSDNRNPQLIQPASVDMVNNVIYNWGQKSAYGNPKSLNLINNYYVAGPNKVSNFFWNLRTDADYPQKNTNAVYRTGNVAVGFTGSYGSEAEGIYAASPRFVSSISNPSTAASAYNYVITNVGANRPVRDTVDARIISNLINRDMVLPNGETNHFIDAADVIWPNLNGGIAPADVDDDGMPNAWEISNFGTEARGSATNSSGDFDNDGYTDLEEYLNRTDPTDDGGPGSTDTPVPTETATDLPTSTFTPTITNTVDPSTPTFTPTFTHTPVPQNCDITGSVGPLSPVGTNDARWGSDGTFFATTDLTKVGRTGDLTYWNSIFAFPNVNIPQGAIIDSATLTVTSTNADTGVLKMEVVADISSTNPSVPTSATAADTRAKTTAEVGWNFLTSFAAGSHTSPDIKNPIQEVVNQTGWAANNTLILYLMEDGQTSDMDMWIASDEHLTAAPAVLTINYTVPVTCPPTATPIPTNTETPVPPTETPVPPTETPVPPTETPLPPTETPTATAIPADPTPPMLLSFDGSGFELNGFTVEDEDIVAFNGTSFSMFVDGSDLGLTGDINNIYMLDSDTILFTLQSAEVVNGVGAVNTWDIIKLDLWSSGETTEGTMSLYFGGDEVGLDLLRGHDIDAFSTP